MNTFLLQIEVLRSSVAQLSQRTVREVHDPSTKAYKTTESFLHSCAWKHCFESHCELICTDRIATRLMTCVNDVSSSITFTLLWRLWVNQVHQRWAAIRLMSSRMLIVRTQRLHEHVHTHRRVSGREEQKRIVWARFVLSNDAINQPSEHSCVPLAAFAPVGGVTCIVVIALAAAYLHINCLLTSGYLCWSISHVVACWIGLRSSSLIPLHYFNIFTETMQSWCAFIVTVVNYKICRYLWITVLDTIAINKKSDCPVHPCAV